MPPRQFTLPSTARDFVERTIGRNIETDSDFVRRSLLVLLGAAFVLRAACALLFAGEIDTEGAEYARIAENIRYGRGYSGIATEGVQLFFPPLFPALIAGFMLIAGDAEIAGRAVNVVFGSLLVLPVYGIARRLIGPRLALAAAALVAMHPFLIGFSTTVFCETAYTTLLLAAVYAAMRASDGADWRMSATAGGLYGLAYLVRPEAAAFMGVAAVGLVLQRLLADGCRRGTFGPCVRSTGLMIAGFLLLAAPHFVWLSLKTGELRIETKSILNLATEARIQRGLSVDEAAFAVDNDLNAQGVWNRPNINVMRDPRPSKLAALGVVITKAKKVIRTAPAIIAGSVEFGSPALFALFILGLFSRPQTAAKLVEIGHLLALLALSMFALLFIYYSHLRFYVLYLVVFCIFAPAGIQHLANWGRASFARDGASGGRQFGAGLATACFAVAAVMVPAAMFATGSMIYARGTRSIKMLSTSMANGRDGLRIADTSTPFAFHARAGFVWLPYCDGETARRYLAHKGVTHVVLRSYDTDGRPYLRSWSQAGVPGAQLVGETTSSAGELVRVFKLAKN